MARIGKIILDCKSCPAQSMECSANDVIIPNACPLPKTISISGGRYIEETKNE